MRKSYPGDKVRSTKVSTLVAGVHAATR